jgi:hypothetical protein
VVIQYVWLSGTIRLVIASIPIPVVIVGLITCFLLRFILFSAHFWNHVTVHIYSWCDEDDRCFTRVGNRGRCIVVKGRMVYRVGLGRKGWWKEIIHETGQT